MQVIDECGYFDQQQEEEEEEEVAIFVFCTLYLAIFHVVHVQVLIRPHPC